MVMLKAWVSVWAGLPLSVASTVKGLVPAVVGVPDEQWGEAVVAAVSLREGQQVGVEALQQWVKDRLRSSRTPERIDFWEELPYNETGKLLRRKVRAQFMGA